MQNLRFFYWILLLAGTVNLCLSDESEDVEDKTKNFFDDTVGQSMKGFGDFFKGVADGVKDKSEDGMDMLKTFSDGAKDKSEDVAEGMKGFAENIGDSFSKAKDKFSEHGEKMKEALGDAVQKSKKEFETAASEISKHATGAGEAVMKMFG